jgi:1-acyl-sn-glycerol-3-phosphate acyltransferase
MRLKGWSFEGQLPDVAKMIVIGAPHTTNWDFILFLAALHHFDIDVSFIGKHTLFRWPLGWFFRALGGIPVDRSKPGGLVRQVVAAMESADQMILVIAPEGTRKAVPNWKSGFLKIAEVAEVPVVLGGVDFSSRRLVIGPTLRYEGDPKGFMDEARTFYSGMEGLHPELHGPVRVRGEAS